MRAEGSSANELKSDDSVQSERPMPAHARMEDEFVEEGAVIIAMWVAEAVVKFAAGQALASVFEEPQGKDPRVWIEKAVAEIKAFIADELRKQLTEQYVVETTAKIHGAIATFKDYDVARDEHLLVDLLPGINTIVSDTLRIGPSAILLYSLIFNVRLLVLAALVKNHGKSRYGPLIDSSIAAGDLVVSEFIAENLAWHTDGIAGVTPCSCGDTAQGYVCGFKSRVGGQGVTHGDYQVAISWCTKVRDDRIESLIKERDDAVEGLHKPLRQIVESWKKLSKPHPLPPILPEQ